MHKVQGNHMVRVRKGDVMKIHLGKKGKGGKGLLGIDVDPGLLVQEVKYKVPKFRAMAPCQD